MSYSHPTVTCWSSCSHLFWRQKYNTPHAFRLASYSTTILDNVSPFGRPITRQIDAPPSAAKHRTIRPQIVSHRPWNSLHPGLGIAVPSPYGVALGVRLPRRVLAVLPVYLPPFEGWKRCPWQTPGPIGVLNPSCEGREDYGGALPCQPGCPSLSPHAAHS